MKVIFLDIDGVLNVITQGHDEFGGIFHKHFEDNLRFIIDETQAKIVLSSSWRLNGLDEVQRMWKGRNLPGELIDVTPNLTYGVDFRTSTPRGKEIQMYLDNNPDVESFVIIDDDNDMLESQMPFFVRTFDNVDHEDSVDVGYGLTRKCAQQAINILNK